MRLLILNSVLNYGSTGRIVEDISRSIIDGGHSCLVARGVKYKRFSIIENIKAGSKPDLFFHEAMSFLLDAHG